MQKKTRIVILVSILSILLALLIIFLMQRNTSNISQIQSISAKEIVYTKIGEQEFDITNLIEQNPTPTLSAGMIPVKPDGEYWKRTTFDDNTWFDYTSGKPAYMMLNDGVYQSEEYYQMPSNQKLAKDNIGTQIASEDVGSIYMWIPKFAYTEENEIIYIKTENSVSGTYTLPELFKYKVGNTEFSLSGIWVEINEIENTNKTNEKVTNLNKGETDNTYRFLANTKANAMTETEQSIIKIFVENILNNASNIPDTTNRNYTLLKVIDTENVECISGATATYDAVSARITVSVTSAKNGISKIVDENGEELEYVDGSDKKTAKTSEDTLLGNGVYYYYVIDTKGNVVRLRCEVTGSSVYMIKDRETLILFRNAVNGGQTSAIGYQVADVQLNKGKYTINEETGLPEFDSSAEQWTPIGNYSNTGKSFTGKYYGNNHTIKGIILTESSYYQGFIGGASCEIMDLNIEESYIYGYDDVGGIVGIVKGNTTIKNCSYGGKVSNRGGNDGTGGIVGKVEKDLTLSNCSFNGLVTGNHNGGLIGYITGGSVEIKECTVEGKVNNNGYSGGLVGYCGGNSLNITDSENWAVIQINTNEGGYSGGILGYSSCDSLNITNCSNHANVTKNSGWNGYDAYIGGVIGVVYGQNDIILNNCYNDADVYGKGDSVGGIIGFLSGGKTNQITNCYNNGNVSGQEKTGGIIGHIYGYSSKPVYITNCYNNKKISGSERVGGIVGNGMVPYIKHCYNIGEISGSSNYVGGIAGWTGAETSSYTYESKIEYTYNAGKVTGKQYVGGIVGQLSGENSHKQLRINNTYNTGEINGTSNVGGIAGYIYIYYGWDTTYVKYSYNTGNVSGRGVIGKMDYGNIEECGYLAGTGSNAYNAIEYATIEEMPTLESVVTE